MTKFFTMIFWLAISIALLSSATHPCHSESDTESAYEINDVGTIEKFGVKVEILPETDMFGVVGFQVSCTYDDPFFDDNPVAVLLFTKHYIAGRFGFDATAASPFIWSNARDTKFAIVVHPKVRTVDGQLIPYLDVRIYCNNAEREYAYIKAKKTGEYFAITPEGYETQELSTLGRTIEVSGEIFSLVSLTLTVIDTIFLTHSGAIVFSYVLKTVSSVVISRGLDNAFEYIKEEHGMKAVFHLTNWRLICQACGEKFELKNLIDGQLVQCPNPGCEFAVNVYVSY